MKKHLPKIILGLVLIVVATFSLVLYRQFQYTIENRDQRVKDAQLIVWTYSSFMDNHGPATELKQEFEKTCECTIIFVDAGGGPVAIEKMKLDPARRVDVLLGVDLLMLPQVAQHIRIQQLDRPKIDWVPELSQLVYPRMIPYNWSPMGFIYRADKTKPIASWEQLKVNAIKKSISVQDPTLSAPGKLFLYWLYSTVGLSNFEIELKKINENIYSYSPSWSAAYGLFRSGQTDMVYSYLTSLIYHWDHDKDNNYQFMVFSEGHPVQIEYALVPDSCWNCNVAKKFVTFLLTPFAQKILAEKNFMLPVNAVVFSELSPSFSKLPKIPKLNLQALDSFSKDEEQILKIWREGR